MAKGIPKAPSVLQSTPRITTLSLWSAIADSMGFFNSTYINTKKVSFFYRVLVEEDTFYSYYEISILISKTPANPTNERIVTMTDQVLIVFPIERLKYSL